jgi:hypothetical protein
MQVHQCNWPSESDSLLGTRIVLPVMAGNVFEIKKKLRGKAVFAAGY